MIWPKSTEELVRMQGLDLLGKQIALGAEQVGSGRGCGGVGHRLDMTDDR